MVQNNPVDEETFGVLSFISGTGFWLLIAVALVVVVLYKKFKK